MLIYVTSLVSKPHVLRYQHCRPQMCDLKRFLLMHYIIIKFKKFLKLVDIALITHLCLFVFVYTIIKFYFQNLLFYYESETCSRPSGVLLLEGCYCERLITTGSGSKNKDGVDKQVIKTFPYISVANLRFITVSYVHIT